MYKKLETFKSVRVPTGEIRIVEGTHGKLEMLSIGDYGKGVNLNQRAPVPDGLPIMPLTEKWVVTISTQYGCSMGCVFCDVPKVGPGRNATADDLAGQILNAIEDETKPDHTSRLNVHYARMGEPTWNPDVLANAVWLHKTYRQSHNPHPVVSTMMPHKNKKLIWFLKEWMRIKNDVYDGEAGLQLSINSTCEVERKSMFSGSACSLLEAAVVMGDMKPRGRKITLNFAVAGYTVDADLLASLFSPDIYICKLTPMHKTVSAEVAGIRTRGDYTHYEPYEEIEERLEKAGYEVLTFIASREEDKSRITCGNAILAGGE